jgi:hypothetical protein
MHTKCCHNLPAPQKRLSRPVLWFSHSTCQSHSHFSACKKGEEHGLMVVIKVEGMVCTAIQWPGNMVQYVSFAAGAKVANGVQCYPFSEAMFQYMSFAAEAKVAVWSTHGKGPCG